MKSKIVFFSLLLVYSTGIIGCADKLSNSIGEKHIIPNVPVFTKILFNFGGENEQMWLNNPKYFTTSTPDGKPLGYSGHGIVIFTGNGTEFYCFDATCTACSELDSHFGQKDLSGSMATCPVCHTRYSLLLGQPFGNNEKIYPLKSYPITRSGNYLIVNNY